jgi:hypothetical protein
MINLDADISNNEDNTSNVIDISTQKGDDDSSLLADNSSIKNQSNSDNDCDYGIDNGSSYVNVFNDLLTVDDNRVFSNEIGASKIAENLLLDNWQLIRQHIIPKMQLGFEDNNTYQFKKTNTTNTTSNLGKRARLHDDILSESEFLANMNHFTSKSSFKTIDYWHNILNGFNDDHDGSYYEFFLRKNHFYSKSLKKMKNNTTNSSISEKIFMYPPPVPVAISHPACWGPGTRIVNQSTNEQGEKIYDFQRIHPACASSTILHPPCSSAYNISTLSNKSDMLSTIASSILPASSKDGPEVDNLSLTMDQYMFNTEIRSTLNFNSIVSLESRVKNELFLQNLRSRKSRLNDVSIAGEKYLQSRRSHGHKHGVAARGSRTLTNWLSDANILKYIEKDSLVEFLSYGIWCLGTVVALHNDTHGNLRYIKVNYVLVLFVNGNSLSTYYI